MQLARRNPPTRQVRFGSTAVHPLSAQIGGSRWTAVLRWFVHQRQNRAKAAIHCTATHLRGVLRVRSLAKTSDGQAARNRLQLHRSAAPRPRTASGAAPSDTRRLGDNDPDRVSDLTAGRRRLKGPAYFGWQPFWVIRPAHPNGTSPGPATARCCGPCAAVPVGAGVATLGASSGLTAF